MNPTTASSNPLFPNAVRVFKSRTAPWLPYIFGGCFGTIGLVAFLLGIAGLFMGGGSGMGFLPVLIGLVFIAVGVGIPLGMYFFAQVHTITCRAEGFTVRTDNKRKGTAQHDYTWEAVTETTYEEFHSRNRNRSSTTSYFAAETAQGRAFKVGRDIGDFAGLIKLFNAMTTHLPYTWEPQAGFSVSVGVFSAGRSAYLRTPRPALTSPGPSAAPPTAPTV